MSKINAISELMKNHKAASVLPPQSLFQAAQTRQGRAMFFSIGDDHVFYLMLEQPGGTTGWVAKDLSSELGSRHGGGKITAETFSVTQNAGDGAITVALVVCAEGDADDHLYVLPDQPAEADAPWLASAAGRAWAALPYDDAAHPLGRVNIGYVYLTPAQEAGDAARLVAGVRAGGDNYIQNYSVALSGGNAWAQLQTAENFQSVLSQRIGKAAASAFPGLYQLTSLNDGLSLDFTPLEGMFGPPTVIKLKAPEGATRLAAVPVDGESNTNLFVAGKGALYLFTPDGQGNFASGVQIIGNKIFAGVRSLEAYGSQTETVVWGLNQGGEIFYTRCAKEQEGVAAAWSYPVPLLTGVEQITSFVNQHSSSSVIFAHTSGNNLVQLVQDPVTTNWQQRQIVLPTPKPDDVVEYNTYTTNVQLTDDSNLPLGGATLSVTSTSPCSVYIDDAYHVLSADVPTEIVVGVTGVVTIVQQTQALGAVCYHLELKEGGVRADVNPMSKLIQKMSEDARTGDKLGAITITDSDGTTRRLLPESTSPQQKEAAANAIQQFVKISEGLPADGSIKPSKLNAARRTPAKSFVASPDTLWGVSFEGDAWQYHEGAAAASLFGLHVAPAGAASAIRASSMETDGVWDAVETTIGDIFRWLKHAYEEVKSIVVKVVDEVVNFFIKIGETLFRCVIAAISDVVNAVELVFNKIEVFFEDLVKWLGFVFDWNDILRTHKVLKNIIKQYLAHSVRQIENGAYRKAMAAAFEDVQKRIDEWAGLKTTTGSLSQQAGAAGPVEGQNSPQSHWGVYHLQNNAGSTDPNVTVSPGTDPRLDGLLHNLSEAAGKEGDIFKKAFDTVEEQIVGQIATLSAGEVVARVLAVLADILVESVENVVNLSLDVMAILAKGIIGVLDTPMDIPVISWMYEKIALEKLTLLDAACLILAIPATIIYKLAENEAPFPDDAFTDSVVRADSWQRLQQLYQGTTPRQHMQPAAAEAGAVVPSAAPALSDQNIRRISLTLTVVAGVSSIGFIALSGFKARVPQSKGFSVAHGVLFYTTTAPSIAQALLLSAEQTWDKLLAEAVYGVTAVQKCIDIFTYKKDTSTAMQTWAYVTKPLDCALGVAGLVPVVAGLFKKRDVPTITATIVNTCWNANRILTPFADSTTSPNTFNAKMGFIAAYGVGQFVLLVVRFVP